MDTEVVKLAICAVVVLFVVFAWSTHALVTLFVTGKPLLQRRQEPEEPPRIHRIG